MANEFIWHDPVEAQQAMSYAANAAKADLVKQENLYRMAELGLRRQQQQETAQLNQLITASQLQQRQIENERRAREFEETAKLTREGYTSQEKIAGLRAQYPSSEDLKQKYDERLRQQQEQQEASLANQLEQAISGLDDQITKASTLEKAPKELGRQVSLGDVARIGINPIYGMSQLDYSGKRNVREYLQQQLQREPTDDEINKFTSSVKTYRASPDTERLSALQQRKLGLMAQLTQYGWTYNPSTKKIIRPSVGAITAPPITGLGVTAPPTASALNAPPPVDTRMDAIKREAALAIQRGANPAAVYQRMAEMGVDIR